MRVWALNLDAEQELAHASGGAYTASRRTRAQLAVAAARFRALLPTEDRVLEGLLADDAAGRLGVAWCPTPSALAGLAQAGAVVPAAPPLEVLRAVNQRAFAFALARLPADVLCAREPEAEAALGRPGDWLIKRGLSFAGRGRRRHAGGPLDDAGRAWLRAALRQGPVLVTPWLGITLEVGLHGAIEPGGEVRRGRLTRQRVDPHGQHAASELADAGLLTGPERRALDDAFDATVAALQAAGYFGPFGIDAFRYRGGFHPLSDLNARYSMGWPVGMGGA